MPNLDFYAVGADFEPVLDYVFERSGCRVFESYSQPDAEIREFESASDIYRCFPVGECKGSSQSIYLQLVPPGADILFNIRRIELNPATGHGVRFSISGWGLIQLYLGGITLEGRLIHSHTNHNSEKRAQKWSDTITDIPPPDAWDWKAVNRTSSAFNRYVRKLSVFSTFQRPALSRAAEAIASGVEIVGVATSNEEARPIGWIKLP
jgi:hypothetical protein